MSSLFSSTTALDMNRLQNYSINGIPVLTYGLLGITTVVLATVTLSESSSSDTEANQPSMVSQLPSLNPFSASTSSTSTPQPSIVSQLPSLNPFTASTASTQQKTVGGRQRKTKGNKHKNTKASKTRSHR
jgi:hypothetical protein